MKNLNTFLMEIVNDDFYAVKDRDDTLHDCIKNGELIFSKSIYATASKAQLFNREEYILEIENELKETEKRENEAVKDGGSLRLYSKLSCTVYFGDEKNSKSYKPRGFVFHNNEIFVVADELCLPTKEGISKKGLVFMFYPYDKEKNYYPWALVNNEKLIKEISIKFFLKYGNFYEGESKDNNIIVSYFLST